MIVLGLLLGLVGTDVNSGVARFAFGMPELTDGLGVVSVAMGLFGFAEIISNLETTEKRELVTEQGARAVAHEGAVQGRMARVGARHGAGLGPRAAARRRRDAGVVRLLRAGEEGREGPGRVRQGRDRGCRRAGVGEQRGRADFVHPAAHARHPGERGDGADGRRDDDPQHPARAAGHDEQSRRCSGA